MKKIYLVVILLFLFNLNLFSQGKKVTDTPIQNKTWMIGAHIGACSGAGLAVRKEFNKFAIQVNFMPPWIRDERINFMSGGLMGFYKFYENINMSTFSYLSVGDYFSQYVRYTYNYQNGDEIKELVNRNNLNFGTGLGLSFRMDIISLSFMAGYGLYTQSDGSIFTSITGEISVLFYVK